MPDFAGIYPYAYDYYKGFLLALRLAILYCEKQ
jgi:hypothetical protein